MQIYYPDLPAIEQQTRQLTNQPCRHCKQTQQLVSHGFIYKKRSKADPEAVGKRVFCSNRNRRTGCGRTMQLYMSSIVRYLHYAGHCVVLFMLARLDGLSIQHAYQHATGATNPRNAYRWVEKLWRQLSVYRCLFHQPLSPDCHPIAVGHSSPRWTLLGATFRLLSLKLNEPICAAYQLKWQQPFL
jgi:hypothetical protein